MTMSAIKTSTSNTAQRNSSDLSGEAIHPLHHSGFSRRDFLKSGGAIVVTFSIGGAAGEAAAAAHAMPKAKSVATDEVDGFLAIDAKGNVTVFSGKVDLGTGIRTAMTQIAAEELSVPMNKVTVIQGDTLLTPDQGVTFGSLSIQNGGMQIRQAAATARQALLAEAATKLGVAKDALSVMDGVVVPKTGGKGVAYAQLVGGKDFTMKVDPKATPKDPKDYTICGKPVARLDIPDKVTGRFTYMQDFRRPGMIHARVVHPPAMKASLQRHNDWECLKTPGYIGVVRKGNFLAVLGKTEWAAIRASRAIETSWSDWKGLPEKAKLWEHVRNTKINKDEDLQKVGNSAEALAAPGVKQIKATYDFAIHTRFDRSVVRRRRVRRRQADVVERVAADALAAQADGDDARDEAGRRPLYLHRRLGLLRPQRS
jgi:nicotinate dehydrogenase subunit B